MELLKDDDRAVDLGISRAVLKAVELAEKLVSRQAACLAVRTVAGRV